jgi:hypothetical protein
MTIEAMKQALEALDSDNPDIQLRAATALRAAIDAELEQTMVEVWQTAPSWVGLTDEEIKEIIGPWGPTPIKGYTRKLFDQIEAKLKEKNR